MHYNYYNTLQHLQQVQQDTTSVGGKVVVGVVTVVTLHGGGAMKYDVEAIKRNHDLRDHAGQYTTLKRVTSKEMAGPCPKCGGHDRFHCKSGWFFCRQCYPLDNGQAHDIFGFYEWAQGWDFVTACEHLGGERAKRKSLAVVKGKGVVRAGPQPLNENWQTAAALIRAYCAAPRHYAPSLARKP
jgi:hypothetical protein